MMRRQRAASAECLLSKLSSGNGTVVRRQREVLLASLTREIAVSHRQPTGGNGEVTRGRCRISGASRKHNDAHANQRNAHNAVHADALT